MAAATRAVVLSLLVAPLVFGAGADAEGSELLASETLDFAEWVSYALWVEEPTRVELTVRGNHGHGEGAVWFFYEGQFAGGAGVVTGTGGFGAHVQVAGPAPVEVTRLPEREGENPRTPVLPAGRTITYPGNWTFVAAVVGATRDAPLTITGPATTIVKSRVSGEGDILVRADEFHGTFAAYAATGTGWVDVARDARAELRVENMFLGMIGIEWNGNLDTYNVWLEKEDGSTIRCPCVRPVGPGTWQVVRDGAYVAYAGSQGPLVMGVDVRLAPH